MKTTVKRLKAIVERINKMTGNPLTSYRKDSDGVLLGNIGNYHLDGAYNGWALYQISTEGGGTRDVLQVGHVSKPELERLMFAFIRGIETKEVA